tara:strand:+ start:212 stop:388 length:177 start_codon:yes stop_codon:yes gene_type:complete
MGPSLLYLVHSLLNIRELLWILKIFEHPIGVVDTINQVVAFLVQGPLINLKAAEENIS